MKQECILIGKEAHFYMESIQREQRGCTPLTEEMRERIWNRLNKVDGCKLVTDDTYGGGDGKYYGKWTSWSVETVKKMLMDAGYTWKAYGTIECINV